FVGQVDHGTTGFQTDAVIFKGMGIEHFDRQSLFPGFFNLFCLGREGDGIFSRRDPVDLLARIANKGQSRHSEKLLDKFGSKLWIVIEKEQRASASWFSRVLDGNLPLPLRVQQIST